MPSGGDELGMFRTVELNTKDIAVIKQTLEDHAEQMEEMKNNAIKLETTVTLENRETRAIVTQQVDKLYVLVEKAMGFRTESASQEHELKMLRWNTMSTVFLKIAGSLAALASSGGVIYYLIVEAPK
ncbi:hypothetical protein [Planococcus faecalis]|uniref:TMhelix containing protein n=1 Tax=Planococcus faecalis TaxID=1598147 RepID=A0ABM6ITQ0_9BACL|nr:hypothetical protein [Planococcus faecalis]AQU79700.1 hypothetical protein AJGP001_10690 [Planococcus faecalis]OHX55277.1 hypothetical protein BB777_04355 [Planococcus faecalis]